MAGARVRGPPAAQVTPAPGRAGARSGAVHARRRHGPRGPWGDPPLRALLLLILCVACGAAQQPGVRLRVAVRRPGVDSARFEAGATARRCGSGRGVVVEGVERGNGLLVWLRFPDSLGAGSYQPLVRGDTTTPRGAVTVVRWMQGSAAHGMVLDSGAVTVTPTAGHEAGKHVLCEKPTAVSATEAQRMLDASERRPRQIAWVDHEIRYEPNRRKARDLIRAGAIGEVRHLELVLRPYLRGDGRVQTTAAPWTWWLDASRGGGILGAVGSHLVDLCRFWTGSEIVSVAGGAATFDKERADEAGLPHPVTADQFASFVLRMANGEVATVTLSSVAFHGPGHFAQVTGTAGSLVATG